MKAQNIRREFFSQSLTPRETYRQHKSACILGFDTEYDSKTSELVCFQLSYKGAKRLYTESLSWETLYAKVTELVRLVDGGASRRKYRSYILATYFSIAEAQHLDIFGIGVRIDEWGQGNYDFTKSFPAAQQTIRICDTQQFFRGLPLKTVAKTFGLEKLEYDVTHVSQSSLQDPAFKPYALNDAWLVEQILNKLRAIFLRDYEVDILSSRTPANTAAIIFLKDFLGEKIDQPNFKLRRLILLASWGGNNQCFIRGEKKGHFRLLDAVSMYPNSALALGKLPTGKDWVRAKSLRDMLRPGVIGGVVKVKFEFPEKENYPCLPVWSDKLRALCYPLGGTSYCSLAEVKLALRLRARLIFCRGYYFKDGVTYLQDFLRGMLARKSAAQKSGDKPSEAMYKLLMNAIIGKFTQKTIKTDINDLIRYANAQGMPLEFLVKIGNFPRLSKRVNLGNIFYPEWNCLILGYARATIAEAFYKYRAMVGTTDSFITEVKAPQEFLLNRIPFKLKKTGNRLIAVRTRVYVLYNNAEIEYLAHHGIHNREIAPKLIALAGYKEGVWYRARHIVKLRESLKRGKHLGQNEDRNMYVSLLWDNKRVRGRFYTTPLLRVPDG